jgi:SsrA-binding protein
MEKAQKISVKNRKASFEFELLDEFEVGIVLFGSEVKSIRSGNVSITEAYCYVNKGEIFIKNMHIQELKNAPVQHEPLRERKLLLTKKEIIKIETQLKNKGLTLVPTYLYNKKGLIKLKLRLAKGKKLYDKRESIKAKDVERDLKREGL